MELNQVLQRLKTAGALFLLILVVGSVVYSLIDKEASLLDAFYMSAITITTIGFHEVIDLSEAPAGRIFTVLMAFSGIGIITYFFSNLASLFIEGDIKRNFERKKMEKRIAELSDHFVICGSGRVGRNIALELLQTDRGFVMADLDGEVFEKGENPLSTCLHLIGDCTEDDFLLKLGVDRAKGIFVTSGEDNVNLVITLSVRTLNPSAKIVALSKDINLVAKLKKAGADRVVAPTYIGGLRMAAEMVRPTVTSFLDEMLRSELNHRIEEVSIPESMDGKELGELNIDQLEETMVLALKVGKRWVYKPSNNRLLKTGDLLIILTNPTEKHALETRLD